MPDAPNFDDPDFDSDAWYRRSPEEIRRAKQATDYQAWRDLSPVGMADDERTDWEARQGGAADANDPGVDAAAKAQGAPTYVWGPHPTNKLLPVVEPGAKYLLDQFSNAEGTSDDAAKKKGFASGYDATFGYRPTPKPLSQMTLDEVDQFQSTMGRHTPVGRYQNVQSTLRGLRKNLGLKGSDTYSAEMQDRLGRQLMHEHGYDNPRLAPDALRTQLGTQWDTIVNGTMDPNTFFNAVAKARTMDRSQ